VTETISSTVQYNTVSSQWLPNQAALPTVPSQMAHNPERAIRGDQLLSDDDLQVLRGQPWGDRLLTLLTERQFHLVHRERERPAISLSTTVAYVAFGLDDCNPCSFTCARSMDGFGNLSQPKLHN
jgi:hypothetical protein